MGQSATAHIAWGVNFNQGEYDELHKSVEHLGLYNEDADEGTAYYEAFDGTPLENVVKIIDYGYADAGEDRLALILTRSHEDAKPTMPHEGIDPETLAYPNEGEQQCIDEALNNLGFTGDRTLKLLLLAEFG